ncbi:MAG: hypothetical protein ACP5GU_09225 [Thermoprotei archaeon]|jgi:hypothetical protein
MKKNYIILIYYEIETELTKEELKELVENNKIQLNTKPKIIVLEKV